MPAGMDQFMGFSAIFAFRLQFVEYFLVNLIKIVVTLPKAFSGIKLPFTVITGLPSRTCLEMKHPL